MDGRTVLVTDVVVKVNLGVLPIAVGTLQTGPQDVVIFDTDRSIFGGVVERHGYRLEREGVELEIGLMIAIAEKGRSCGSRAAFVSAKTRIYRAFTAYRKQEHLDKKRPRMISRWSFGWVCSTV